MKQEANSSGVEERNGACRCPDCRLPPQGPPADLRDKAVAIWCGTYYAELATEMGQDAAEGCASAFAYGFEKGLTTAMLRPEWAQAFYLKLREYYLMTHTADLAVWEQEAERPAGLCRLRPRFRRRSTGFHPKACLPVVMVTTMELKRKLDPTLAPNSPALVA